MTTHEVLVAARNLIDREGWKQADSGGNFPDGPGNCAYIALWGGSGSCEQANAALTPLAAVLGLPDDANLNSQVYVWNDAPERTKEEVLAAFDKAITETAPAPDLSFEVRESKAVFA